MDVGLRRAGAIEPAVNRVSRSWTLIAAAGAVGILLVGGAAGWMLSQRDANVAQDGPPVIKADDRPIKVHPEQPGGLEVPNRDRLIYRRLQGEADKPMVERLLPGPEQPLPVPGRSPKTETGHVVDETTAPAIPAAQPTQVTAEPAVPAVPSSSEPASLSPPASTAPAAQSEKPTTVSPAAPAVASNAAPAKSQIAQAGAKAGQPSMAGKITPPDAVAKPKTSSPALPDKPAPATQTAVGQKSNVPAKALPCGLVYQVQIIAARSEDAAKTAWSELKGKHPELLGSLSASVSRKELSDRGTFYRLRAGPFDSEAKAKALCGKLAGGNVSCVIIQPQG
jgi:hypothetical protein